MSVKFGGIEYSVALIDPSAIRKEPKIPELDLPAKVVVFEALQTAQAMGRALVLSSHDYSSLSRLADVSSTLLFAEEEIRASASFNASKVEQALLI